MSGLRFVNITTPDGQERQFAIGLWWQLRHAGPAQKKVLLQNARKIAEEFANEQYNVVLLREQQFGLGRTGSTGSLSEPVYSLADALRMQADAFVAVFSLEPELWWVCAVSKGIIAAEGDAWFETREEAERAAHSHQQMISAEIQIFETPEASLEFLLPLLFPERTLQELYPDPAKQRKIFVRLGQAAALLAAAGGIWFGWNWYQGREASRLLQSQAALKAKYEAELRANPERVFKMHWNQAPAVEPAGLQCMEAIISQPQADLGWTLDELICTPGKALAVQRRHNPGANFMELPKNVRLVNAQRTAEQVQLEKLPVRASVAHTNLPGRAEMTAALYEITQILKCNLENLSWQPPEQITRDEVHLTAPWQGGKFSIKAVPHSAVSSGAVFRLLDYHGLIINTVIYNAQTHVWTVQGVCYAKTAQN